MFIVKWVKMTDELGEQLPIHEHESSRPGYNEEEGSMNRFFALGKVSEEVQGLTDQKDGGGQYFGGNVHKGSEDDEMERENALFRSYAKNHNHIVNQSLYNMEELRRAQTILHTRQNGQVETFELNSWGNVLQALNGDYGIRFGDPESSDASISSEEALNEGIAVITNDGRLAFSWEGPTNPTLTRPKHENMQNANEDSDEEGYRETFNNSGADDVIKGCPCGFCHQAARRLEQIRCPECRRYHMAHPVGSPGFNECVHISQAISLLAQEHEERRLNNSIWRLQAKVERLKNLRKINTRHLGRIEAEEKEKLQTEAPDEASKPSLSDVREAMAKERHPGYEQERVDHRLMHLAAAVGPHDGPAHNLSPEYSPCSSPEYSPRSSPEPSHYSPDNAVEGPEKKRPKLGLAGPTPNLPKASRRFRKGLSAQVSLALSETWDPDNTMTENDWIYDTGMGGEPTVGARHWSSSWRRGEVQTLTGVGGDESNSELVGSIRMGVRVLTAGNQLENRNLKFEGYYNPKAPFNLMPDTTMSKLGYVPDWEIGESLGHKDQKYLRHRTTGHLIPIVIKCGVTTFSALAHSGVQGPNQGLPAAGAVHDPTSVIDAQYEHRQPDTHPDSAAIEGMQYEEKQQRECELQTLLAMANAKVNTGDIAHGQVNAEVAEAQLQNLGAMVRENRHEAERCLAQRACGTQANIAAAGPAVSAMAVTHRVPPSYPDYANLDKRMSPGQPGSIRTEGPTSEISLHGVACLAFRLVQVQLHHERMMHHNITALVEDVKSGAVTGVNLGGLRKWQEAVAKVKAGGPAEVCGTCAEAKARPNAYRRHDENHARVPRAENRNPIGREHDGTKSAPTKPTAVEDPIYNQLGDLVHMDGITSPVEDESGNVGAIVFKDEATKSAFVYPYKLRIEVYEIIPKFAKHLRNTFGSKLKIIRTDQAPEFTGDEWVKMSDHEDFETQYSGAYEPAQNSEAERMNGVLQNMARAALMHSRQPARYWSWAMLHAAYTRNRIGHKRLGGRTPYQLLYGKIPDLSDHRVWGCNAWALIPSAKRKKWCARAIRGIFIGYSDDSKCSLVYCTKSRRVLESSQIIYDEFTNNSSNDVASGVTSQETPARSIGSELEEPAEGADEPAADATADASTGPAALPFLGSGLGIYTTQNASESVNTIAKKFGVTTQSIVDNARNYADTGVPINLRTRFTRGADVILPQDAVIPVGTDVYLPAINRTSTQSEPASPALPTEEEISRQDQALRQSEPAAQAKPASEEASEEPSSGSEESDSAQASKPRTSKRHKGETFVYGAAGTRAPVRRSQAPSEYYSWPTPMQYHRGNGAAYFQGRFSGLHSIAAMALPESAFRPSMAAPALWADGFNPLKVEAPRSIAEALTRQDHKQWTEALAEEYKNLFVTYKCLKVVPWPNKARPISTKIVFKVKPNAKGEPERWKCRCTAREFKVQFGYEAHEVHAPVCSATTNRTFAADCTQNNCFIRSTDVPAAYLQGKAEKETYLTPPKGWEEPNTAQGQKQCWKLETNLYGCRPAGHIWGKELRNKFMESEQGFRASNADPCLFRKIVWIRPSIANRTTGQYSADQGEEGTDDTRPVVAEDCSDTEVAGWTKSYISVIAYVDDIVYASPHIAGIIAFESAIVKRFNAKLLGDWKWFLGLNIVHDREAGTCKMSQETYIEQCVARFELEKRPRADTPFVVGQALVDPTPEEKISTSQQRRYMEMVGSLMYLSTQTRFDITATVSVLAQFNQAAGKEHFHAVERVFAYLLETKNRGLMYRRMEKGVVTAFSDASFGCHGKTGSGWRRSRSGGVVCYNGVPVSWFSKSQSMVTLSSCECEYVALSQTTQELRWVDRLATFLGTESSPLTIYCDNTAAKAITELDVDTKRSRHIDIRYHYVRELVQSGEIVVVWVATSLMVADILTKSLDRYTIEILWKLAGCV